MRMIEVAIMAMLVGGAAMAQDRRPADRETTIDFAGNGGLRDWQPGPRGSDSLYVRDRRERWYRVTLSGPCVRDRALDTLTYTTNVDGRFDRFSRVSLRRFPDAVCGVRSITTSPPPPGQPGAPRGK